MGIKKATGKMTAIIVAVAMCTLLAVLALAGCSSQNQSEPSSAQQSSQSPDQSNSASPSTTTSPDPSKILVAYFSASGNTERVAQDIASDLGADTFVITPEKPYTQEDLNWTQDGSRVNVEHEDESARDTPLTQVTPDDFADYGTVFIGYPIWWGGAAWPVDGFVSGNDWNGKTVIPFCTSESSGIGSSATQLEQLSNGGNWLEGERFSENANAQTVQTWVDSLNLKQA